MESQIQEAIKYIHNFPGTKIAKVAREFEVPVSRLRHHLKGRSPKVGQPAKNTKLLRPEEAALCRYIDRLDNINLAVRVEFVTDAANSILRERFKGDDIPIVGTKWTTRFLRRHNYFKSLQKKLNSDHQSSENLDRVTEYFQRLQTVITEEGIVLGDIWNMDETGFQIGVGKDQLIVTKRKRAHYFGIPENRESATAIEAISAGGRFIPAFLILSGQLHMSQWYQLRELEGDTVIGTSSTGYSNDELGLNWIKHFDKHTVKGTQGSKRLLIIDGHGSHHTKQFIQYCDDHGIIPFGLPPHLTHLLQPLDVVVFQPYKHYHAKALDIMVRDGLVNITKLEFLGCIQQVRKQAFKRETILSAFRKTGISPFNPQVVLGVVASRLPARTPTPPPVSILHSSPFSTPITLRQMNKIANKVKKNFDNIKITCGEENLGDLGSLGKDVERFVKGALTNTAELIQTKRDLGRTRYAEQIQKQQRALKNSQLQSGGVLTVDQGREMVLQRKESELIKAMKVVEAAQLKARNASKRCFNDAAKEARKWRITGRLDPAEIYESGRECRFLKLF